MEGLPSGWSAATLEELVDHVTTGIDPSEADGLPYVGLEHIESGAMRLTGHSDPSSVRSRKTLFKPGDVLYGKLRPYLDKCVLADGEGICSTDILVLRPGREVDPTSLRHTCMPMTSCLMPSQPPPGRTTQGLHGHQSGSSG